MAMDMDAIKRLRESKFIKEPDKKEKDRLRVLEVLFEMKERGFGFSKVDLYQSHATRFTVKDGKILPPLTAVPLGEKVAVVFSLKGRNQIFPRLRTLLKGQK